MRQTRYKRHVGICECGCGAIFNREYRTRRPRYLNDTHRDRAERARQRARILAWRLCNTSYNGDMGVYSELYWHYMKREQAECRKMHCNDRVRIGRAYAATR